MLGVLAEDQTDCETIEVLAKRIVHTTLYVEPRPGHGCGNLEKRAARWINDLARAGYPFIVVIQDADGPSDDRVRKHHESITVPPGVKRHICIPVHEIEAWFLADEKILARIAGKPTKSFTSPHLVPDPKAKLRALSRRGGAKSSYNPNDNPSLARDLSLDICAQRCVSFRRLREFLEREVKTAFDRKAQRTKKPK